MSYDSRRKNHSCQDPAPKPEPKRAAPLPLAGEAPLEEPAPLVGIASSPATVEGECRVKRYGNNETVELELALAKRDWEAERDLMAMREWVALMSLAEARRHLDTVIDELAALSGEESWPLPECPRRWSDRQWLIARRTALWARVMQRLANCTI
jgi:hypothetical protein